jgi:hypothetical protein
VSTFKQLPIAHTLKMEAARSSETLVTIYQLTRRHITNNSVRVFLLRNSCEENVQFITTVQKNTTFPIFVAFSMKSINIVPVNAMPVRLSLCTIPRTA